MKLSAFRSNRAFRFASILALWAMLLPALLPLMHPMAAMATAGGNSKPICHMMMVMGDNAGDHKSNAPQNDKSQPSCPICQGIGSLAQSFTPPDVVKLVIVETTSDETSLPSQTLVIFKTSASAQPRAPPSLAS